LNGELEKNIPEWQNPTVKGIGHYMATVNVVLNPKIRDSSMKII
jgi:hypothetical protein